jgi:predicted O-linked N-acetylglucosamine transferase (SPINDLY family)
MRGLVAQLTRDVFEVTVISIGRNEDEIARFFREHADRYLEVPNHVPSARRLIADQKLDVLFYADIGMDHTSYSLAFSRLAPVQCVTWGHPVTTGIETVDYFVSCELMEIPEAQEHYTETLIQLKHPPIYYYRPAIAPPSKHRADFGLTKEDHVYICLQTASKFHPDFDELLGGILRGDPRGQLVLSQWLVPSWERHLRQRFAHTLSDVLDRIRFVPMMKYHDYLSLVAAADVQLDPIHFGGGNTSYDAFSVGTPIVTLPSKFLRGRFTLAMYKQMGFLDCVAGDRADYVKLALRLGTNPDFRDCMHNKILAASHVLFENGLGVRELERFLQEAVAKTRS